MRGVCLLHKHTECVQCADVQQTGRAVCHTKMTLTVGWESLGTTSERLNCLKSCEVGTVGAHKQSSVFSTAELQCVAGNTAAQSTVRMLAYRVRDHR